MQQGEILQTGDCIADRYQVEQLLGQGGMAEVYRVRHTRLQTLHALKVLHGTGENTRRRLVQEGKVQAAIRHPNIVSVTDIVDVDGSPGLVMEYVRGPTLKQLLAERSLTIEQVDELAVGILSAVRAAHDLNLIHRDLKPANVLLQVSPHGLVPKIADFGLVKLVRDDIPTLSQTRTGMAMGTPSYMAPEQIRDAKSVGAKADLWSLGAILFEMLAGRKAFAGFDIIDVFNKVVEGTYPDLKAVRPDIPERMELAIRRALVVREADRIGSVKELLEVWKGNEGKRLWGASLLGDAEALGGGGENAAEAVARSFRDPSAEPSKPAPPTLPLGQAYPTISPGTLGAETVDLSDSTLELKGPIPTPDAPPRATRQWWFAAAAAASLMVALTTVLLVLVLTFGWYSTQPTTPTPVMAPATDAP